MINSLGKATKTLSGSQGDLFATLTNLQKFTTMLKDNDGQVRLAEQQLVAGDRLPRRRPAGPRRGAATARHRPGRRCSASSRTTGRG